MGNSAGYFKGTFQPVENSGEHSTTVPDIRTQDTGQILIDPRSPATDFTRTPIQVEGKPIRSRSQAINSSDESYQSCTTIADSLPVEDIMIKLSRLRFLTDDPRSPSVGIPRTPIQVVSTPDCTVQRSSQYGSPLSDSLVPVTSMEDLLLASDDSSCSSADVDKPTINLQDPRSPCLEVIRTPIQVQCLIDSNKASADQIDSNKASADQNIKPKIVFENNPCDKEATNYAAVENQTQSRKPDDEKVALRSWNKENGDSLARKLFSTPNSKGLNTQAPFKLRTPLRCFSGNENSPQNIIRLKQARGINQELIRSAGIENTPPDTSLTRSKQLSKYNMSSEWDKDTTIVI